MNEYIQLKWDTDFFGFKVAKLIPEKIHSGDLNQILHSLKKNSFKLIYFFVDTSNPELDKASIENQGVLVDELIKLPHIHEYATNNAHLFYILCRSEDDWSNLLTHLNANGIMAIFHYLPLHKSQYYEDKHDYRDLPMSEYYSKHLIRLPMYYEISPGEISFVCSKIKEFFEV